MALNISPQTEARLFDVARQEGIDPAALVERLVKEYRPTPEADQGIDTAELDKKLRQWQEQDGTKLMSTQTIAELYAQWAEEDAKMTDAEREAETQFWEDFQKGINETRAGLGMRQL